MAKTNKLNLASIQADKLIAELPERREKIKTQIQFINQLLESQKRVNYQNEFDRLQGADKLTALQPDVTSRMKGLQNMARKSLKGDTHAIYIKKNSFICHNI